VHEPMEYFSLEDECVREIFSAVSKVWEVLPRIPTLLSKLVEDRRTILGEVAGGAYLGDGPVFIGPGARIEPGAYVASGCYIGPGVTVRHGAYVRSGCIFLPGSMLGHASEAKNSVFLPGARAPHFAYVGDSVLGSRVNLGAGTKLSNLPVLSRSNGTVRVRTDTADVDTGLRKFGAVLGDDVQIGCNAVLSPGTLVGPRSVVYPSISLVRGDYPADTIVKLRQTIQTADLER
jgi:bifunctional UDP-N-acetylglucosamine pyrophosphorylase / glucosamine-1-phosphate N-acetyltransferase